MRATIEDVAREAGVSIATVSRYVNGNGNGVSAGAGARLKSAIESLGYVPNSAARTLKTGRTRLIGVVLTDIAHMYWSSMLAGIEEGCQALGYGVLIGSAGNSADTQSRYLSILLRHKVDGLLFNPAMADPPTVARWAELKIPVIMLDRTFPALPYPLVAVDNAYGAELAVDHLLAAGHREIGFISWEIEGLGNRQERLDGYHQALTRAGIELNPEHIVFARESWDDGVRVTTHLFARADPPTAIFSANMELNLQVLAGLKGLGLRIPEDVSLVGFDDAPWDPLLEPPLTAIATPPFRLGKLAALRLCRAIERGRPLSPRESRMTPTLIVRDSVAVWNGTGHDKTAKQSVVVAQR